MAACSSDEQRNLSMKDNLIAINTCWVSYASLPSWVVKRHIYLSAGLACGVCVLFNLLYFLSV